MNGMDSLSFSMLRRRGFEDELSDWRRWFGRVNATVCDVFDACEEESCADAIDSFNPEIVSRQSVSPMPGLMRRALLACADKSVERAIGDGENENVVASLVARKARNLIDTLAAAQEGLDPAEAVAYGGHLAEASRLMKKVLRNAEACCVHARAAPRRRMTCFW